MSKDKEKEEIIINDVNVAECEFLRHCVIPDNEGCKIDDSLCCDVGNCYYKQLQKAKKQIKDREDTIKNYEHCRNQLLIKLQKIYKIVEEKQCNQDFIDIKNIILYNKDYDDSEVQ